MELNQESLLKVFGESAEMCAGSILLVVDGVKQEVATANLHTGAYTLSKDGEEIVKASIENSAAPAGVKNAKVGGKGVKNTPIETLPLPGVTPALDAAIEEALVGLDFAEE